MSGSAPTPAIHPANIFGAPGSTAAGVASWAGGALTLLATGFPVNPAGWIVFGIQVLGGLGAILGKS